MTRRVLVVDDNATLRALSRRVLESLGFEVDEAVDGQDGLTKAEATSYALVLTDVRMARVDGLTMVERIRALDSYRKVPILVVTTDHRPQTMARGRAVGANAWLVKPFQREQLLEVLKTLTRGS